MLDVQQKICFQKQFVTAYEKTSCCKTTQLTRPAGQPQNGWSIHVGLAVWQIVRERQHVVRDGILHEIDGLPLEVGQEVFEYILKTLLGTRVGDVCEVLGVP